jgi:predicted O-linked N-acetylglucosamine transferase (SPINDLY family)
MSQLMLSISPEDLYPQAKAALAEQDYAQATLFYEQLAGLEPDTISHIWYLGLSRLLAGYEAEAQFTWMMALSELDPEKAEAQTDELLEILSTEAARQEQLEAWPLAWALRQYLREMLPNDIHNLLHLMRLAVKLHLFEEDYPDQLGVTELLHSQTFPKLDQALVLTTITEVFEEWFAGSPIEALIEAALPHVTNETAIIDALVPKAFELRDRGLVHHVNMASYLAEIALRYRPEEVELLKLMAICHEHAHRYNEAVAVARRALAACQALDDQMICLGFLAIRMLRVAAYWPEAREIFQQQQDLMPKLLEQYTPHPERPIHPTLLTFCSFYTYYLDDAPAKHRQLQNQLAALVQTDTQFQAKSTFEACQKRLAAPIIKTDRKLKIGYVARYMVQHPVGWLARWLMKYHDTENFDIYTYHLHQTETSDFTKHWFVDPVTRSARFEDGTWSGIARHICDNDKIDILIDLDSITYSETCSIMALKPAPIQVSWMGFDTSGIPAIDYFIADPYVLPEQAQDYYSEKIWRLPNTYIAVDGFEIGVPTLRRDQLGISNDAVIYLSAQDGRKRHPDTIQAQIQILRQVPNSYLLIKGIADESSLRDAFEQVADQEGVGRERLRFLERDINETSHRANLGIADVVLDTFPYNGATTTLETLWTGVPIVTQVGQQWAARNSYTMLKNAGIDEGIAWTTDEYIEWGEQLGKDAALRQMIRMKLLQSRQAAPLWNTRQFAKDMEDAYRQMWQKYVEG